MIVAATGAAGYRVVTTLAARRSPQLLTRRRYYNAFWRINGRRQPMFVCEMCNRSLDCGLQRNRQPPELQKRLDDWGEGNGTRKSNTINCKEEEDRPARGGYRLRDLQKQMQDERQELSESVTELRLAISDRDRQLLAARAAPRSRRARYATRSHHTPRQLRRMRSRL